MSNDPKELQRAPIGGVLSTLTPGMDPRAIVAAVFQRPFKLGKSVELQEALPIGKRVEITLTQEESVTIVGRVTPEQLLAIVASIIALSPNATEACKRIRDEVAGWKFEGADGSIA